jgi:hypothetical protein
VPAQDGFAEELTAAVLTIAAGGQTLVAVRRGVFRDSGGHFVAHRGALKAHSPVSPLAKKFPLLLAATNAVPMIGAAGL